MMKYISLTLRALNISFQNSERNLQSLSDNRTCDMSQSIVRSLFMNATSHCTADQVFLLKISWTFFENLSVADSIVLNSLLSNGKARMKSIAMV